MSIILRRVLCLAGTLTLSSTGLVQAQEATFHSQSDAEVVPGQYIIKTEPGYKASSLSVQSLGTDVKVLDTLPLVGVQVIEIEDELGMAALERKAARIPGVAYMEPVYVVRVDASPNDPKYPPQWGFPKIKAPAAWDVRTSSDNKVVAVIDTGVDYLHPDLAANMWKNPNEIPGNGVDDDGNGVVDDVFGANFVASGTTGDPMDDNQHGTHVAGTIGAVSDNNLGVAGVNWKTQIMGLKFLSAGGGGSTAGAIRAIEYAIKMKADVMNNSWGGGGASQALKDVIQIADDKGILFVAAAGNNDRDTDANPHYPSNYDVPNVLSVMATDQSDARAGFSNYGLKTVDMAAPGVAILSTTPGGDYKSFNGTSMATPHVAGAAALIWAQNPSMSHLDVKKRLMDTAEVIPGLAGKSVTGARLDLAKALGGGGGPKPKPNNCENSQHTQIAYNEFRWSAGKTANQNSNLLSVEFTLPEKMIVDISAHGSARRTAGSGNTLLRTGVYGSPSPNAMWTGSYRRVNFASTRDNKIVSSNFATVLPAGNHTIYWKAWLSNATLRFDSGTLIVRGIPCSMGGILKNLSADGSIDTTEADANLQSLNDELETDVQGNSATRSN